MRYDTGVKYDFITFMMSLKSDVTFQWRLYNKHKFI